MACRIALVVVCAVLVGTVDEGAAQPGTPAAHPDIRLFFQAAQEDKDLSEEALEQIAASWRDGYVPIIRDMMRLMQPPQRPARTAGVAGPNTNHAFELTLRREHPSIKIWRRLLKFLEDQTGQRFRGDMERAQ